ncbi:MAG: hypothetical protein SFX73_15110 [Kofleriaceae bacterium]|nr:hypothetical protein [Kofleriaceae bacterium]
MSRNDARGGGLISADVSPEGIGVVIAKFPQQPHGMTYEGTLIFANNGTTRRAVVSFTETGTTGIRDALLFDRHLARLAENVGPLEGWMRDPYDASRMDPLMRNDADDEQYDHQFPDHPLTLVRAELARLQRSL